MNRDSVRLIGILAAIGVFAMPLIITIRKYSSSEGADISANLVAIFAVAVSLALQLSAIVGALQRKPGSDSWAKRVAEIHGWVALLLFVFVAFSTSLGDTRLFGAWMQGFMGDGAGWNLLPFFLLVQWVCFKQLSEPEVKASEVWRGVVIASLASCAIFGLWVFSPMFSLGDAGERWHFFDSAEATFFNIGVLVHLIAIWAVASRAATDWIWAAFVGFGCLITGFILSKGYGEVMPNMGGAESSPLLSGPNWLHSVGSILYMGWFLLSPYLPIVAYALIAWASVALRREKAYGS
jgi:hypothetical protein